MLTEDHQILVLAIAFAEGFVNTIDHRENGIGVMRTGDSTFFDEGIT